jgi:hypothetical protein
MTTPTKLTKKAPRRAPVRRGRRARPTAAQFYATLVYRLSIAILVTIVVLHVKGN